MMAVNGSSRDPRSGCGLRGAGWGDRSASRTVRLPVPYLSASARADRPRSRASRRMSVNSSAFDRLCRRASGGWLREAAPAGGSWSASACCRDVTGRPARTASQLSRKPPLGPGVGEVAAQVHRAQVVGDSETADIGKGRFAADGPGPDRQRTQRRLRCFGGHRRAAARRAVVAPGPGPCWAAWSMSMVSGSFLVTCSLPDWIASTAAPRIRWDRLPIIPPVRWCR